MQKLLNSFKLLSCCSKDKKNTREDTVEGFSAVVEIVHLISGGQLLIFPTLMLTNDTQGALHKSTCGLQQQFAYAKHLACPQAQLARQ